MHKLLTIILIVLILLLMLIKFWLVNIPEVIPIGSEIGEIIENVAISYIAAYIFYLMQVWYPNLLKEKSTRKKFIPILKNIEGELENLLKIFYDSDKFNVTQEITKENIEHINLFAQEAPIVFVVGANQVRTADYTEYIVHVSNQIKEDIDKIDYFNDFDNNLKDLLVNIESSNVFTFCSKNSDIIKDYLPNNLLSADIMVDWLNILYANYMELKNYSSKNQKQVTNFRKKS